MEYYISYHRIIDFFKQYQEQSPRLNSFGHGDVVYFSENMSGTTNLYPYMFITPISITYLESTTQYQFQILFTDIVNTDLSNEIDVITDMSIEAKNLIAEIKRGDLQDYLDCIIPATSTTFQERFNDHVGGVQLDLTIEVFDDINACVMYPTPTPSATPSQITPTPTSTPTPTPTPTCSLITQYVEAEVIGGDKIRATLWSDSGYTISADAVCDYEFYGTMYGSLGTEYSSNRTFPHNSHQLTWNFNQYLQPGETITGFTITNVVINCPCVELIY